MALVTITIQESTLRLVAGIPNSINLETNIPATVFYTIDGTEPTLESDIAVGWIKLPGNMGTITLKAFAYDGIDISPTISQDFGPNTSTNRNPRDKVQGFQLSRGHGFPFSSIGTNPLVQGQYLNTGGLIVNDPEQQQIPDGYDGTGTGTPSNYTNQPLTSYQFLFSKTNSIGEMGKGIGTVPAAATVVRDTSNTPPIYSDTSSAFFDARAMVIFQDSSIEPYDTDVPKMNRPYFSLENTEKARDGILKQTSDVQPPTGSATIQYFNAKDSSMQYSYFDSRSGRWIFSKVPIIVKDGIGDYSTMVFESNKGPGARYVYKWIPFQSRKLT